MIALRQGDTEITYNQLKTAIIEYALELSTMITEGDRVGIFMDNSIEYVVAYLSIIRAGGIVVPLNTQLKEEIKGIVEDCTPSYIITNDKYVNKVKQFTSVPLLMLNNVDFSFALSPTTFNFFSSRAHDDICLILYTSGTTGKPKGVTLTRNNIECNAHSIINYLSLTHHDSVLANLPFFYAYGNSLLTTHLLCGGTLVVPTSSLVYPSTVIKELRELQITGFAGVPSTFTILLPHIIDSLPYLRYVTQAGGRMTHNTVAELKKVLTNTEIFIMYGQTEATARLTYLPSKDLMRKPGSIGLAIPGVDLVIDDTNELLARGSNVMLGYWNDVKKDKYQDTWLRTGDLAEVDEEGYYYIIGRKSEMIKTGGYRISPLEIEEVISTYPGVQEVAVVGVHDAIDGQSVTAVIVGNIEEKRLKAYCSKKMARYKVPKHVISVAMLPRTASGKLQRNVVVSNLQLPQKDKRTV